MPVYVHQWPHMLMVQHCSILAALYWSHLAITNVSLSSTLILMPVHYPVSNMNFNDKMFTCSLKYLDERIKILSSPASCLLCVNLSLVFGKPDGFRLSCMVKGVPVFFCVWEMILLMQWQCRQCYIRTLYDSTGL